MDVLSAAGAAVATPSLASSSLSVVVPAYNEQAVLPEFHRRLTAVLDALPVRAEIVYVNDGSSDTTRSLLLALREIDPRVAVQNVKARPARSGFQHHVVEIGQNIDEHHAH